MPAVREVSVSLTVNGAQREAAVPARTLLVHLLRDHLGLTGTHVGCDTTQCGACTVALDGVAVKSCTVLAAQADGCEVTTIEGLGNADGTLHPVQQAFQDEHALQCGYCTPGMVMAVRQLVEDHPSPTEDQVRHALDGNICRCTGYQNIVAAALRAAAAVPSGPSAQAAEPSAAERGAEPPATEPPATEPPATEPPATEPPATEPPATEPPATEPPATEPPPTEPEG